eukprot:TRINITY_DN778170_c0_g1_i1.p1 TRINITY_DN778170_c0_g1~~TRINITY_DN778170_c0_g1_i1.p1  ORF type:complete len:378 (-),score=82.93 TRINITY_DN778170_c0_g1_i1:183-1190(-)
MQALHKVPTKFDDKLASTKHFIAGSQVPVDYFPDETFFCCFKRKKFVYNNVLMTNDYRRLQQLGEVCEEEFDEDECKKQLKALWEISFSGEYEGPDSPNWKLLGFPCDDIRDSLSYCPVQTLNNVYYLIKKYDQRFTEMVQCQSAYGFGSLISKVTFLWYRYFCINPETEFEGVPDYVFPFRVPKPPSQILLTFAHVFVGEKNWFEELFCTTFFLFHGFWLKKEAETLKKFEKQMKKTKPQKMRTEGWGEDDERLIEWEEDERSTILSSLAVQQTDKLMKRCFRTIRKHLKRDYCGKELHSLLERYFAPTEKKDPMKEWKAGLPEDIDEDEAEFY